MRVKLKDRLYGVDSVYYSDFDNGLAIDLNIKDYFIMAFVEKEMADSIVSFLFDTGKYDLNSLADLCYFTYGTCSKKDIKK